MSVKLETFLNSKSKKMKNFEKYQKSVFVQISFKTSNVLPKESKIEKINVTMIKTFCTHCKKFVFLNFLKVLKPIASSIRIYEEKTHF